MAQEINYQDPYAMIEAAYLAGFEPDDDMTPDEEYEGAMEYLNHLAHQPV